MSGLSDDASDVTHQGFRWGRPTERVARVGFLAMLAYSFFLAAVPGIDLWWWLAGICAWIVVLTAEIMTARDGPLREALTPGWRSNTVAGVLVVYSYSAISIPDGYLDRIIVSDLLWLLVGAVWFGRLIASLAVERLRAFKKHCVAWLVLPGLMLLLTALEISQAPLWTSYLLSKNAMNDQAHAVLAGKDPQTIRRIGVYPVSWAERRKGFFRFEIDGSLAGFAYSPDRKPPCVNYDGCYKHWDGPWYTYTVPVSD